MVIMHNNKTILRLKEKVINMAIDNEHVDMVYKGDITKFVNSKYYNVLLYKLFKGILINILGMNKSSTNDDICSYIKTYKYETSLRNNTYIGSLLKSMLDIDKIVYNNSISIDDLYLDIRFSK